ncbi:MAG: SAM-dependent methyltransferase, partial [Pseudonocardia sp.]|nr:SAM-dependent methyltransferase [Pseudonocardia sp.]
MDTAIVDPLRTALIRHRYTTDAVRDLLGPGAHAALGRGEVEPAFRAARGGGELGVLVRLLLLGSVEPDAAVAAALAPLSPADAAAAGLLQRVSGGPVDGGWVAALDLRPYGVDDPEEPTEWWVLSDLDTRRQERDHVTGAGGASLTLAAATDRRPVGSLLDLGTGCGVQAQHAPRPARAGPATAVAPRARAQA